MSRGLDFCNLGTSCTFYKNSGSDHKKSTSYAGDLGSITGSGRSLEKGMATHSSILTWRTP